MPIGATVPVATSVPGEAITPTCDVSVSANVAHGVLMAITTVRLSTRVTATTEARRCSPTGEARWASRLATTASASNGVPSWKRIPRRNLMVHRVKVGSGVIDSASSGRGRLLSS